eukprot:Gb_13394 [translate_table: standard]
MPPSHYGVFSIEMVVYATKLKTPLALPLSLFFAHVAQNNIQNQLHETMFSLPAPMFGCRNKQSHGALPSFSSPTAPTTTAT